MANDTPWMSLAESHLGLAEKPGATHDETIVGFFAAVGQPWLKTDEEAWCAAFAGTMLKRTGYRIPTDIEAVRARGYGEPIAKRVTTPRYGDLVLIGKPGAISHVTFYANDAGDRVRCLGGNQGNSVKYSNYKKDGIEGYYRPVRLAGVPTVEVPPAPPPSTGNSGATIAAGGAVAAAGVGVAIWDAFGWIGAAVVGAAAIALAFVIIRAVRRKEK